ncbi:MAG TPA: PPC domain-containing protein, partial [Treponemataceae bacterium]|nr:PPC domain-containing protein [Treponemataceae bacterium]
DGLDDDPVTNILGKGIANKQHHTFHLLEGDIDVMAVNLEAGKTYTFMTEAGPLGADTYMILFDPSGAYIDEHDDIDYPNNLYSKITYEAEKTGYHLLILVDEYQKYGDYYVYYDEGDFGPSLGKTFRKWTPDRKDKESYKISLP